MQLAATKVGEVAETDCEEKKNTKKQLSGSRQS